jgi:hypothetical protein
VQEEEHHHLVTTITIGGPERKETLSRQIKQMTKDASIVELPDTSPGTADAQKRKESDKTDPPRPISLIGSKKITTKIQQTQ